MKRKSKLTIATATAVLAVLGGPAVYAQAAYSNLMLVIRASRGEDSDEPEHRCPIGRLGASLDRQLQIDAFRMGLDGLWSDTQLTSDFLVG